MNWQLSPLISTVWAPSKMVAFPPMFFCWMMMPMRLHLKCVTTTTWHSLVRRLEEVENFTS